MSDASADQLLGSSVAIDGDRAVAGAPLDDEHGKFAGAAYGFQYDGSRWLRDLCLSASDSPSDPRSLTFLTPGGTPDDLGLVAQTSLDGVLVFVVWGACRFDRDGRCRVRAEVPSEWSGSVATFRSLAGNGSMTSNIRVVEFQ